jgi:hypothetical protein
MANAPKRRLNDGSANALFFEAVRYMLTMFQRMTIWAKYLKVSQIVVIPISVFVVHTKNFWVFVVATTLASLQHVAFKHGFSNRCKLWLPYLLCRFVDATFRAIFTLVRWGIEKFYAAMRAYVLSSSFLPHRYLIAFWRTVFSFVGATSNVRELCGAHRAC